MKVTFYDYKHYGKRLDINEVQAIEDKGKDYILITLSAEESERLKLPWILDINKNDFSIMEVRTPYYSKPNSYTIK